VVVQTDPRTTSVSGESFDPEAHQAAKESIAKHMGEIGFKSEKMLTETM